MLAKQGDGYRLQGCKKHPIGQRPRKGVAAVQAALGGKRRRRAWMPAASAAGLLHRAVNLAIRANLQRGYPFAVSTKLLGIW